MQQQLVCVSLRATNWQEIGQNRKLRRSLVAEAKNRFGKIFLFERMYFQLGPITIKSFSSDGGAFEDFSELLKYGKNLAFAFSSIIYGYRESFCCKCYVLHPEISGTQEDCVQNSNQSSFQTVYLFFPFQNSAFTAGSEKRRETYYGKTLACGGIPAEVQINIMPLFAKPLFDSGRFLVLASVASRLQSQTDVQRVLLR